MWKKMNALELDSFIYAPCQISKFIKSEDPFDLRFIYESGVVLLELTD